MLLRGIVSYRIWNTVVCSAQRSKCRGQRRLTQALFIYDKFVRKTLKVPDTKDEQKLVCGYNLLFDMTQSNYFSPFHFTEEFLISINTGFETLH